MQPDFGPLKPTILVMGSLNMDLVVQVPHQPVSGETVLGSDYVTYPGGKGANQAVAAARMGATVQMAGLVGEDAFGTELKANLERCGVDIQPVQTVAGSSGIALITVDAQGQNRIVVSPGANGQFTPDRIPKLAHASLIVMQLEIPLETVSAVVNQAKALKIPVLLNPAPMQPLPDDLLKGITYLILNQTEAEALSGVAIRNQLEGLKAARQIRQKGIPTVIITMGEQGVIWSSSERDGYMAAYPVQVVDTTAAGDAFCGAFAAWTAAGMALLEGIKVATAAAALAVTRAGAQPSLPTVQEVEFFFEDQV